MSPQVDVLIPVYGVEHFIAKCLQSVLAQDYENMRVVLVEDASPDNSLAIAEQIIKQHNLHQHKVEIYKRATNGGIGAVREQLLSHLEGKYALFIDSDDYWDNERVVTEWVNLAEEGNYEVVIANYCHEYPSENRSKAIAVDTGKDGKQLACDSLKGTEGAYLWNKLFLSETLIQYRSMICPGRDLWEDLAVVVPLLYRAQKVGYYPKTVLHYLHHGETQYTGGAKPNHITILKSILDDLDKELSQERKDNALHRALNSAHIRAYLVCCKLPYRYYQAIRQSGIKPQDRKIPPSFLEWSKKVMYLLASNRTTSFLGYLLIHGAVWMKRLLRYIV